MKKFDHLTSLDAIDPLPCRLGGKVDSGKPEAYRAVMRQELDNRIKHAVAVSQLTRLKLSSGIRLCKNEQ